MTKDIIQKKADNFYFYTIASDHREYNNNEIWYKVIHIRIRYL